MRFKKGYNQLYIGSATWSIPLEFASYVLNFKEEIEHRYRYTVTADEVFIQSICMNSDFRNQISDLSSLRYIDWGRREGNSPRTFTIEDKDEIEEAMKSSRYLFARKFSSDKDYAIVEFLVGLLKNNNKIN